MVLGSRAAPGRLPGDCRGYDVGTAQAALYKRARLNGLARSGAYSENLEAS